MVDRSIFVANNSEDKHKITQEWSLHAQVTLTHGKSERDRDFEFQRGNITFTSKPPGDSGYGSERSGRFRIPLIRRPFQHHQPPPSSHHQYDKKCQHNSCKVTVDCTHSNLFPRHTVTLTTDASDQDGVCEICCGIGSRSPTTARRQQQFTSHFCTRVPDKKQTKTSRDASIQTSFQSVPDVLTKKESSRKSRFTSKSISVSNCSSDVKEKSESATITAARSKVESCDVKVSKTEKSTSYVPESVASSTSKSKKEESTSTESSPCTVREASHQLRVIEKPTREQLCPLTKQKRQTLSSGSLRKSPNILMHSSTSAVSKYSNLSSPKSFRKTPNTSSLNLKSNICDKPSKGSASNITDPTSTSFKKSKSRLNPSSENASKASLLSHSESNEESLDSLKNSFSSVSDISRSDTNFSLLSDTSSTVSSSGSSYSDSMSDTSSSTVEDGSVSRSNSFEYADSFEYDDSFDKLRIEEKEKTWRKKSSNNVASVSKDQLRHQKMDEYLTKRSATSPFPSWKSSKVSVTSVNTYFSESSSSSSSSSVSDDGSMSELGWSFASKCNNPTRLNSLNSVTSSLFEKLEKQNSLRKLGPQKVDSLDSGSYSDSSQQTCCSKISVGKREASLPKQIFGSNSSVSKAEKFGPVVNSLRKPGHHIGPSKNPNCACDTCIAYFAERNASKETDLDSFHDSNNYGLDWCPTCEVPST